MIRVSKGEKKLTLHCRRLHATITLLHGTLFPGWRKFKWYWDTLNIRSIESKLVRLGNNLIALGEPVPGELPADKALGELAPWEPQLLIPPGKDALPGERFHIVYLQVSD